MAVTEDVLQAAQRRAPLQPNIDFAIAALGSVAGMPHDAGRGDLHDRPHGRLAGPRHRGVRRAARPVPPEGELRARMTPPAGC